MSRADFRFSVSIRFRWPFGRRRFDFGSARQRRRDTEPRLAIPAQPPGWDPVEPAPPWFAETLRRHRDGTVYYVEPTPLAVGVASVPRPGAPAATEVIPAVREDLEGDLGGMGLYLAGHAAGAHPETDDGARPDVEHLRGFAEGAVDKSRRDEEEGDETGEG